MWINVWFENIFIFFSFDRFDSGLGNLGSGAGKGGGGGGSIRDAGGSMGRRQAANEEEFFYKQVLYFLNEPNNNLKH